MGPTYPLKFPTGFDRVTIMNRPVKEWKEWRADFRAAEKRGLKRRLDYSFVHTFKPVLDEADFRSFESMKTYREWCRKALPSWLGYGRTL